MWSIGVLTGTTSYKGQFRSVRSCRTVEPAMLKGHGTMDNAREHHAGRAARTARALDGCEGWTGGKFGAPDLFHWPVPMKRLHGIAIGSMQPLRLWKRDVLDSRRAGAIQDSVRLAQSRARPEARLWCTLPRACLVPRHSMYSRRVNEAREVTL